MICMRPMTTIIFPVPKVHRKMQMVHQSHMNQNLIRVKVLSVCNSQKSSNLATSFKISFNLRSELLLVELELKKGGQQLDNIASSTTSSEAIARVSTRTISSPEDASTNANGLSESYEPEPDKGESHPGKSQP